MATKTTVIKPVEVASSLDIIALDSHFSRRVTFNVLIEALQNAGMVHG